MHLVRYMCLDSSRQLRNVMDIILRMSTPSTVCVCVLCVCGVLSLPLIDCYWGFFCFIVFLSVCYVFMYSAYWFSFSIAPALWSWTGILWEVDRTSGGLSTKVASWLSKRESVWCDLCSDIYKHLGGSGDLSNVGKGSCTEFSCGVITTCV